MAGTSEASAAETAPLTGTDPRLLGGYRVVSRLGRGGMGAVYLGEAEDGTYVAVKVIRSEFAEDSRFVARFRREAENARKVVPSCTARVLGAGVDGGRPYLVTEYIQGPTLAEAVASLEQKGRSFSAAEVEQLAVSVLTALVAIHTAGVVHRDLKPSNVLLSPTGPRVIDFGIARALDASSVLTQGRSRVGSLGYMAPEQIRGEQVTQAADIFAWGATVVFAANGVGPFAAGDDIALMYRTLNADPELGRLSASLRPLVEQALAKDPGQRRPARVLLGMLLGEHRDHADASAVSPPGSRAEDVSPPPTSDPSPPAQHDAHPPPAPARRARRRIIAAAAALAAAAVVVSALFIFPLDRAGSPDPPLLLGRCPHIEVLTGGVDTPYHRYGLVLKHVIEDAFPGSAVTVQTTSGSSDNLRRLLARDAGSCEISITQLNTAVDARYGIYHFEGEPMERLRTVGPIWFDLIQVLVPRDSGIRDVAELCGGRTVATGPRQSGTQQTGEVLLRQVAQQVPGCTVTKVSRTLSDGLDELRIGAVDAVLWAGGSPTSMIRDAIDGGLDVRLLPLDGYLDAMQADWDAFYRLSLGRAFVPGPVFETEAIHPLDYPGVERTATIAIPNGVAANEAADPDLVRFVAESLIGDRVEFERGLWGDERGGRHFRDLRETVGTSSLYCLVPLHLAAAATYRERGVSPSCPR